MDLAIYVLVSNPLVRSVGCHLNLLHLTKFTGWLLAREIEAHGVSNELT